MLHGRQNVRTLCTCRPPSRAAWHLETGRKHAQRQEPHPNGHHAVRPDPAGPPDRTGLSCVGARAMPPSVTGMSSTCTAGTACQKGGGRQLLTP